MLDHFFAKNATAHKVNSDYTLVISYYTFCVGKYTILGPDMTDLAKKIATNVRRCRKKVVCEF